MELERWIRYLIPGYVAIGPLLFAVAYLPNKYQTVQTPMLTALVALGPGVGFLVHQLHMFFHEGFYLAKPKRPIIVYIMKRYKNTKLSKNKPHLEATAQEALLAWNYCFYDSDTIGVDLRNYILRSWYFIHSFCSTGWAFLVGSAFLVLLIVASFHLEQDKYAFSFLTWSLFAYIAGCIFSFFKSRSTQTYLEPFEVLVAVKHWGKIEELLSNILQLHDEQPVPPCGMTGPETVQPIS